MSVAGAVGADRTKQQLSDTAMSLRPNDEQIGSGAEVDKRWPSFPFTQCGSDDDVRSNLCHVRHRRIGDPLHLLSYLVGRPGEDVAQCHGEHPGGHEFEGSGKPSCLGNDPVKRLGGAFRSIDANDDSPGGCWLFKIGHRMTS